MTQPFRIDFTPTDTPYGDLRLRLGRCEVREDSYYLAIDPHIDPGDESADKTRKVLVKLLRGWLSSLEQDANTFLPFGFSDQSMTWLKCAVQGSFCELTVGWSEDEGHRCAPSSACELSPSAFYVREDVEPVVIYRPRLVSLIRSCIANLLSS